MNDYLGRVLKAGDLVICSFKGYSVLYGLVVSSTEVYVAPSDTYKLGVVRSFDVVHKIDVIDKETERVYKELSSYYQTYSVYMIQANQDIQVLEPLTILLDAKDIPVLYLGNVKMSLKFSNYDTYNYGGHCYFRLDKLGINGKGSLNSILYTSISINKLTSSLRNEIKNLLYYNKKPVFESVLFTKGVSTNYIFKFGNQPAKIQGLDKGKKLYENGSYKLELECVNLV